MINKNSQFKFNANSGFMSEKPKTKPLKILKTILKTLIVLFSLVILIWGMGTLFFDKNASSTSVTLYNVESGQPYSSYTQGLFLEYVGGVKSEILYKYHVSYIDGTSLYQYRYFAIDEFNDTWEYIKSPLYVLFVWPISYIFNQLSYFSGWDVNNLGSTSNLWATILAIFLISLSLRLFSGYTTLKQQHNQSKMDAVKDKVEAIRSRYKDKKTAEFKQKQQAEIMALYRKEKINPLGGSLASLVFAPLLFVMFIVIKTSHLLKISGTENFSLVTTIFNEFRNFNFGYYWVPLIIYLVLFIFNNFILVRWFKPKEIHKPIKSKTKQSFLKGPIFKWSFKLLFLFFFFSVPVGLSVYWIFSLLFEILQKILLGWIKKIKKNKAIAKKRGKIFKLWKLKSFEVKKNS